MRERSYARVMTFTALHRALGLPPGPITNDLLDAAVAAHVEEVDDLDWKSTTLPPVKGLPQHDFPKDVAAMANSGGGLIVYGVTETQKAAAGRSDVGDLDEGHARALRSAAITAISPPVFGLGIHRLVGSHGDRAVVVEVAASVDVPHLIYRGEYFGAPIRNDADTVWMKERQIEAMYRARFEERRHAGEELVALFNEASAGRDTSKLAWLAAVARPRIPRVHSRLSRDDARKVFRRAEQVALSYAADGRPRPLGSVDIYNPRPGLRRWVAVPNTDKGWREARLTVHHDGSVTLAAALGGRPTEAADVFAGGGEIHSHDIEGAVADFMALIRATAGATGSDEYDTRVGINWSGSEPLTTIINDPFGFPTADPSGPLPGYTPVAMTVDATAFDSSFYQQVYNLALDCVNQAGVAEPMVIGPPATET